MFQVDPSLRFIDASREEVVSIIESINHPHIGVPGHAPQATQAFVVGRRNPGGTFSIYVYLYLTEANAAVVYNHDLGEFAVESYQDVEAEALTFMESMGFMVDNVNFRNLSPLQQDEVMSRIPAFNPDLAAYAASRPRAQRDEESDLETLSPDALVEDDALELLEGELSGDGADLSTRASLGPDDVGRIARFFASF